MSREGGKGMSYEIGHFREEDIEPVVELWNMLFKDYALSAESLKKWTFLCPDFDPAGCFVATGRMMIWLVSSWRR